VVPCRYVANFSNYLCPQIVAHQVDGYSAASSANQVDGDPVPVPHFGAALTVQEFHDLAGRVTEAGVEFVIQPHVRFTGQPGEQWTMFFKDPSGNALEVCVVAEWMQSVNAAELNCRHNCYSCPSASR
jgi:extradiol dioxygenase family protein